MSQFCCAHQKAGRLIGSFPFVSSVVLCILLIGCSSSETAAVSRADLGQKVTVNEVEYTVLDATWVPSLGEGADVRMPAHEFLLMRIAVSNPSSSNQHMAAFKLIAADGTEYAELADGKNVQSWLGIARSLDAGENRQGTVLFDAPRAVYELQVADEFYDGETGSAALIHIPIRLPGNEPPMPMVLE